MSELIKKKKLGIPDTYVLVTIFIFIAAIMTYVVPAGEYSMVENPQTGLLVADPTSYHQIEQSPVSLGNVLLAIPIGMNKSAGVINMLFLVSGFLQIVNDTGAIDRLVKSIIQKLKDKSLLVIPIVIMMMSVLGSIGAVVNGVVAFVPLGLLISTKLGMDGLVAVSIIFVATYTGFGVSPIYPTTVQLAQKIADVPVLSGFGFRVVMTIVTTLILIIYTSNYALRVKKDPFKSIIGYQENISNNDEDDHTDNLSLKDIIIIIVLFGGFGIYAYGTIKYSWGTEYMSGIMFAIAAVAAIIARISPDKMVKSFITGCKGVVYACLITGFASGISYILNEGKIIHTIVYTLSKPLNSVGNVVSSYLMLAINMLLNFLIPSGSGQAAVVMPLMAPLSDIVGMERQVAVCAYQWGDFLTNLFNPTSGTTMAVLGLAGVPFDKWLKFVLPLIGIFLAVVLIALFIVVKIGM
jgi:uncharacterized ion transporter superfamily protein YfcC